MVCAGRFYHFSRRTGLAESVFNPAMRALTPDVFIGWFGGFLYTRANKIEENHTPNLLVHTRRLFTFIMHRKRRFSR